jgi:hypothetical protein
MKKQLGALVLVTSRWWLRRFAPNHTGNVVRMK